MSNLLEQASLVMIPSGYKEDIVYSVIPTSGAGDLTFTRASNGTRIDSNGNVEVVPWNLFGNSEDGTSGKWGNPYNIASVTANSITAPNGTNTGNLVVENSSNSNHWFEASFGAIDGTPYTISAYFKAKERTQCALYAFTDNFVFSGQVVIFNLSTGAIVSQSGTQTNSIESVGNGWYRCSMTVTANASATAYFGYGLANGGNQSYQGNGTSGLYMWGRQLNTGTLKPYFPTTDRLNVPRLTYQNGGGGCPSLLLEKQSTNIVTYSEDFSNADWLKQQATISANATTSPDGTQNADKLIINNGVAGGYVYQLKSTSSGTVYTGSFYVKAGGVGYTKFWTNISGSYEDAVINLSTGAITNSNFAITPTAQSVGNGWYRVVYTTTSGGGQVVVYVDGGSTSTGGSYTGNGTDGIFLWGAQVEASSYATSYIPTTSSSATRVADACYKTGISSLIGQTQGSVFFDFTVASVTQPGDPVLWYMKDGGVGERYVELYSNGNLVYAEIDGSGPIAIITKSGLTVGRHKCAIAYATNDFVFYVDGVQIGTDTSGTPGGFSTFGLQYYLSVYTGQQQVNQCAIFPTRLTNSELAQITGNQNYTINQAYESYGVASESPNCVQP